MKTYTRTYNNTKVSAYNDTCGSWCVSVGSGETYRCQYFLKNKWTMKEAMIFMTEIFGGK